MFLCFSPSTLIRLFGFSNLLTDEIASFKGSKFLNRPGMVSGSSRYGGVCLEGCVCIADTKSATTPSRSIYISFVCSILFFILIRFIIITYSN